MRRFDSAVILVALAGTVAQADVIQPFVPATDIQTQIQVQVSFSTPDKFQYRYTIFSSTASRQKVYEFFVETGGAPITAIAPPGWKFVGVSNVLTANWGSRTADVEPGHSLGGFELSSIGLPGTVRAFTRGLAPLVAVESEGDIPPRIPSTYKDAVIETTVGPSTFTFTDPSSAINRLISLKHQSVSLGWLRCREFVEDLDEKLDQAKRALAKGKPFKARKKLEQFVKKLEEQRREQQEEAREHDKRERKDKERGRKPDRDKRKDRAEEEEECINDNAFFLLKVNAEFIISKLPQKPKDKDEERESDEKDD